jgi:hypothetical protein
MAHARDSLAALPLIGAAFRDANSLVYGPSRALVNPPAAGRRQARWLGREAWSLTATDWDFVKRVAVIGAIVALAAGVAFALQRPDPARLTVAAPGRCYIAPDGGARWHSVRQCSALLKAMHVDDVTLAEARRRGAADGRWQAPCRHCGAMLRDQPEFRTKREEYERLAE